MTATLKSKCTEAKIQFSHESVSSHDVQIENIIKDVDMDIEISRAQYDCICKPILKRCMEPLR